MKAKEIEKALKDAVKINALDYRNGKFKYSKKYKDMLKIVAKDKYKESIEDVLVNVLWRLGYFKEPRTVRETTMMCNLLALKK